MCAAGAAPVEARGDVEAVMRRAVDEGLVVVRPVPRR